MPACEPSAEEVKSCVREVARKWSWGIDEGVSLDRFRDKNHRADFDACFKCDTSAPTPVVQDKSRDLTRCTSLKMVRSPGYDMETRLYATKFSPKNNCGVSAVSRICFVSAGSRNRWQCVDRLDESDISPSSWDQAEANTKIWYLTCAGTEDSNSWVYTNCGKCANLWARAVQAGPTQDPGVAWEAVRANCQSGKPTGRVPPDFNRRK